MVNQSGNEIPSAYARYYLVGILLFNRGEYFEAHEAWEWHWKNTPGPERSFYQGLIQIAVALCHFFNGNMHGAAKLKATGSAYLEAFRPKRFGLNLDDFLRGIDHCFAEVIDPHRSGIAPFKQENVPAIRLDPEPLSWPDIPTWILDGREPSEDE